MAGVVLYYPPTTRVLTVTHLGRCLGDLNLLAPFWPPFEHLQLITVDTSASNGKSSLPPKKEEDPTKQKSHKLGSRNVP